MNTFILGIYDDHIVLNIADTYFVSNIGTVTTATVGVFFIMVVIQVLGYFFEQDVEKYILRTLGRGDWIYAEKMAATGYYFLLLSGWHFSYSANYF